MVRARADDADIELFHKVMLGTLDDDVYYDIDLDHQGSDDQYLYYDADV